MAVSLSNIPKNTNVYRFITSGKPGMCKLSGVFCEKLESHHTCYDPEITIDLSHAKHHQVHFWPQRLTNREKLILLKTRFHHQTAISILKNISNNIPELSKLIAPSRSRFVRKAQKLGIKRLQDLKKSDKEKVFKVKRLNKNKGVLDSRMRQEEKRVM